VNSPVEKAQTVKDLRESAAVIRRNGWTQDALYDWAFVAEPKDCPVCAVGAVNTAVCGDPRGAWSLRATAVAVLPWEEKQALDARDTSARVALAEFLGLSSYGVVAVWNDELGRSKAEVVAAFEGAADALEGANK
jgi:hypothetical protein